MINDNKPTFTKPPDRLLSNLLQAHNMALDRRYKMLAYLLEMAMHEYEYSKNRKPDKS